MGAPLDVARANMPPIVGRCRVERVNETLDASSNAPSEPSFAFQVENEGSGIVLDLASPAVDEEVALRVSMTSPAPQELWLFYTIPPSTSFTRQHLARVSLPAGRAEAAIVVHERGLGGKWLLVPTGPRGRYWLHELEVRAVPK